MNINTPKIRLAIFVLAFVVYVLAYLAMTGRLALPDRPADDAEAEALAEQAELNVQILQEQISEQLTNGPASEEQERLDSPIGQALIQQCLQWSELHENHPGESTLQNRDNACDEYRDYIATGKVPE